ncbi:MAG TPA: hypothetical protein VEK34_09635 [Methylocella sp.]|nr:hypothetical protein [Methylocella sp.]
MKLRINGINMNQTDLIEGIILSIDLGSAPSLVCLNVYLQKSA